jgi:hypothetical protein
MDHSCHVYGGLWWPNHHQSTGVKIMVDYDKFKRPGSGVAPKPLDKTELEIVRADMKYLIEKEKENGDWAKWLESQKPFGSYTIPLNFVEVDLSIQVTILDAQGNPVVVAGPTPIFQAISEEIQRRAHINHDPNLDPMAPLLRPGSITAEIFTFYVGRAPENDDLLRCNCELAGQWGHIGCGWCNLCVKPKFMCHGHPRMPRPGDALW